MKWRYILPLAILCIALGIAASQLWSLLANRPSSQVVTVVVPGNVRNEFGRDYVRHATAITDGLIKICGKDGFSSIDVEQLRRVSQEWSTEAAKLADLNIEVRREGPVLTINTAKGDRRFIDGYLFCLDMYAYHYRYRQHLPKRGVHVIDAIGYGEGETLLVFTGSGEIAPGLFGAVAASPSETRIASSENTGLSQGGLAIGRIDGAGYRLEAKWLLMAVQNLQWLSEESLTARICKANDCRDVTLDYRGGKWVDPSNFITDQDLAK
jgi:hypothetical protein